MMLGDGTHSSESEKYIGIDRYNTSSTRLADDVQRLMLHMGYSSNKTLKIPAGQVKIIRGKEVISNYDHWQLSTITGQNNPIVNKNGVPKQDNQCQRYEKS